LDRCGGAHRGGADFAGKRCLIVGSNNSAHDIAADLWEHSVDVTMIQRYSRYLALQLKARMEGIATPVYGMGKVHHTG
jgi:putative flavoprotein involved in K+ transport